MDTRSEVNLRRAIKQGYLITTMDCMKGLIDTAAEQELEVPLLEVLYERAAEYSTSPTDFVIYDPHGDSEGVVLVGANLSALLREMEFYLNL